MVIARRRGVLRYKAEIDETTKCDTCYERTSIDEPTICATVVATKVATAQKKPSNLPNNPVGV